MCNSSSCDLVTIGNCRVSSLKHIRRLSSSSDKERSHGFDRCMLLSFAASYLTSLQLSAWILITVLWMLVFPAVLSDSSVCLSENWCVSTGNDDPCSFYSLSSGAFGQLCTCFTDQMNFTVCLNNVSAGWHCYLDFQADEIKCYWVGIIAFRSQTCSFDALLPFCTFINRIQSQSYSVLETWLTCHSCPRRFGCIECILLQNVTIY